MVLVPGNLSIEESSQTVLGYDSLRHESLDSWQDSSTYPGSILQHGYAQIFPCT
jgi:hypothetical protein